MMIFFGGEGGSIIISKWGGSTIVGIGEKNQKPSYGGWVGEIKQPLTRVIQINLSVFYSCTSKVVQFQTAIYALYLNTKHYLYAAKFAHIKFQLQ